MKAGDLLLVLPGTNVKPGARYSQGVVLEINPKGHIGVAMVAWFDGKVEVVEVFNLKKYYMRITNETR